MISRIREMVALIRCVFYKRKSAIVRASVLAMAFCVLLLSPAVPVRANALTDWEENLDFSVTGTVGTGTYYPVSVEPVTSRYELNGQNYQGYSTLVCVTYQIPVELTISGALQGAYNTGFGDVGLHIGSVGAPGGFAYYASQLSVNTAYDKYGALGLGASFVPTGNYDGKFRLSFAPVLVSQAEIFTLGFSVTYKVFFESSSYDGQSYKELWAGTVKPSVSSQTSGCFYTYSEEKALDYGVQLKRIEQSLALINSNITSTQLALSTAISNQTNALQSSISSAAYDLTNTLITWGGNITGAVNDFRQEILQYMEVSGSHDVIDSSNKTMDTQIKDYNKSESDLMSDASSKLDSVDTTDLSPLKAYEKATTFWTTAVRNLSESIGVFWYIYTFGAMIGLIAFILRLRG